MGGECGGRKRRNGRGDWRCVGRSVCVCVCGGGCLSLPVDGCVTQGSPAGVLMQQHAAFVLFEKGVRLLMTQPQRVSALL